MLLLKLLHMHFSSDNILASDYDSRPESPIHTPSALQSYRPHPHQPELRHQGILESELIFLQKYEYFFPRNHGFQDLFEFHPGYGILPVTRPREVQALDSLHLQSYIQSHFLPRVCGKSPSDHMSCQKEDASQYHEPAIHPSVVLLLEWTLANGRSSGEYHPVP